MEAPSNGPRLSCGRPARRRKGDGRQPVPRQGHNTPFPLERSPPVSFKRLLGRSPHVVAFLTAQPVTDPSRSMFANQSEKSSVDSARSWGSLSRSASANMLCKARKATNA